MKRKIGEWFQCWGFWENYRTKFDPRTRVRNTNRMNPSEKAVLSKTKNKKYFTQKSDIATRIFVEYFPKYPLTGCMKFFLERNRKYMPEFTQIGCKQCFISRILYVGREHVPSKFEPSSNLHEDRKFFIPYLLHCRQNFFPYL